ncbi:hypothetical protein AX769_04445 [Frondihabitans sp. PAMC 28766]|uniref:WXG100 family type VII secretion target n=1 Tax=Frondihabitans sp. PAMC 28766 TaxID=1795630 RepID=UPI00078D2C94|nr:WXG100 family type VII secretion target [Frondihabitans sp. PAMC 28766]AMM19526.1 hypothetical protein AX769_04445 [Frondihabitans sp. PAMC 28766]
MADIVVSSEAVEQASARLSERIVDFEGRVNALNSFAVSVIGSEWSGSAADDFSSDFVQWVQGAHEVHDALARIASLLASPAETYATTEQGVTAASQSSSATTTSGPTTSTANRER